MLSSWAGPAACNDRAWVTECAQQLEATVAGASVTLAPAGATATNKRCSAARGLVAGASGGFAVIGMPGFPLALASAKRGGAVSFEFESDAAAGRDWSKCVLNYKVARGSFLGAAAPAAAVA